MFTSDITWYTAPRRSIPGILAGAERLSLAGEPRLLADRSVKDSDLWFGSADGGRTVSIVIVMDPTDIFAWLNAFSEESFPISQICRVIYWDEWNAIFGGSNEIQESLGETRVWASITVGELIAQGDTDSDFAGFPFSRAAACFTHSVGRAATLYRKDSSARMDCIQRLRALESDSNFASRSLSVRMLESVWRVTSFEYAFSFSEPAAIVDQIVQFESERIATPYLREIRSHWDTEWSELLSPSAEKRVIAFERLSGKMRTNNIDPTEQEVGAFFLAAGAFLVGNGTSHSALLSPYARTLPACFAWFGLLAGIGGIACWDRQWSRVVKIIERQLKAPFRASDPVNADLCWSEYEWIVKADSRNDPFLHIPKLYSRALCLEVVPGALCQIRLRQADVEPSQRPTEIGAATTSISPTGVDSLIYQIEKACDQLRREVSRLKVNQAMEQPSLFDVGRRKGGKKGDHRRNPPRNK